MIPILSRERVRLVTILLASLFLLLLAHRLHGIAPSTNSVTVTWDANPPADNVMGYGLYHGTNSRTYGEVFNGRFVAAVWVTNTTATLSNLPPGTNYFAVTAWSNAGESDFSDEVFKVFASTPKPAPPTNVQILAVTAILQSAPSLSGPWVDEQATTLNLPVLAAKAFYRARLTSTVTGTAAPPQLTLVGPQVSPAMLTPPPKKKRPELKAGPKKGKL